MDEGRSQRHKGEMPRRTVYNLVSALRLRPVQFTWSKPFNSFSLLSPFPHFRHNKGCFHLSHLSSHLSSSGLNSSWQRCTGDDIISVQISVYCFLWQWYFIRWHRVTACSSSFYRLFLPCGIKNTLFKYLPLMEHPVVIKKRSKLDSVLILILLCTFRVSSCFVYCLA